MSLLNKKFLFVHINKSGGGIITNNMECNGNVELTGKHRTLEDMLSISKEKKIDINNFYIFTIVRNPWERMLSMYLFYHKKNYNAPEFFSGNDEIDNDFKKWIKFIYSEKFDRNKIHSAVNIFKYCFSNQLNWIKDKNGKIMKINKIIRFENNELHDFFKNTMKLKKFNIKKKVHPTNHKHYSLYYDDETKLLVKNHYEDDIKYFGYKFEKE